MTSEKQIAAESGIKQGDPPQSNQIQLKKRLGLLNGISIIIGVIVGSGIFVSPGGVVEKSGSIGAALVVWTLCGLVSLVGALCYAELGTSVTASGGDYSYLWLAYGSLPSFLYLWVTMLIIIPGGNAVSALTFASNILQPLYPDCRPPDDAKRLVAFALLLTLIFINCYSVRWSLWLQDAFTLAKVLALALVVVCGLYSLATREESRTRFNLPFEGTRDWTQLASAFYAGLYSYAGWNSLNFVTEELKDPIKNLPRAISISISSITTIYVLANVAYFAVLSVDDIVQSDAIAVTFGEKILGYAKWIMSLSVALATTSGLNACIFSSSRVLFVGARHGQLTEFLSFINIERLTPVPSLLFLGGMSLVYLSVSTQIMSLIDYLIFIEAIFLGITVSTLFRLRYLKPDLPRPIRVNILLPIIYLLVSIFLIIVPLMNAWKDPKQAIGIIIAIAILLSGIPVYYCTVNWKNKPEAYHAFLERISAIVQKLTLSVKPDVTTDEDIDDEILPVGVSKDEVFNISRSVETVAGSKII